MKSKNILLTLFGILIILSLTSMVSSLTFDNVKSYDEIKKTVTITNAFGLGSDLAKVQLTSNTEACLTECSAIINATIYSDTETFLDKLIFKTPSGSSKEINYKFEYITGYEEIIVNDYQDVCSLSKTKNINGTFDNNCVKEVIGTHKEYVPIWNTINPKSSLKGNYIIKLTGYKKATESIDWIPTFFGNEIDEWAWWIGFPPTVYLKFNETGFPSTLNDSRGIVNLTANSGLIKMVNGKLGNSIRLNNSVLTGLVNSSAISNILTFDSNPFTIAFWINGSERDGGAGFNVIGRGGNNLDEWTIVTSASTGNLSFNVNNLERMQTPNYALNGSFNRIVWVREGTGANQFRVYINNINTQNATLNMNLSNNTKQLIINQPNGVSNGTNLDDLQIFANNAWTASDVNNDWNGGAGKEGGYDSVFVSLINPSNSLDTVNTSLNFSADITVNSANQLNATLYIWNNSGSVYFKFTNSILGLGSSGTVTNTTVFNVTNLGIRSYIWNIYGCVSDGNCSFALSNRTFSVSSFQTNSINFTNPVYETAYERFILNTTYSNSLYNLTGSFYYNGTSYTATKTGSGSEGILTSYVPIPTTTTSVNRTFYWQVGLTNVTGTSYYNSSITNQTVQVINLTICAGAPQNVPYINFTFKDETTNTNINVSVDSSTWNYYLGDGSVKKTLSYTSSGNQNANYSFCFAPSDKTIYTDLTFKYASTSYPQRTYSLTNQSLTNSTTATILYLLSTTNGIYSSIQTLTTAGSVISGVTILLERLSGATYTTIGSGTTDSAGIITFFVDFNSDHRITASKTGYVSTQVTIRPTQAIYSLFMGSSSGNASYSNPIAGLIWKFYPSTGVLSPGTRPFNATITSSRASLENCKYTLVNQTNISQVFATSTSVATNTSYCFVSVSYNLKASQRIFGQLAVDTTETTEFVIIDADTSLVGLDYNASTTGFSSFFSDLNSLNEFGDVPIQALFSRLMFFFLIITILMCVFIYISGIEINNPGIGIVIVWGIVTFATAGGLLTINLGSANADNWFKQWSLWLILTFIMGGYVFDTIRRSSG